MEKAQNLIAKSLTGVRWLDNQGRACGFESSRLWGVTDGQGHWLTFKGAQPYSLNRKATAAMVVDTLELTSAHRVCILGLRTTAHARPDRGAAHG